jgi:hypothetical protein
LGKIIHIRRRNLRERIEILPQTLSVFPKDT